MLNIPELSKNTPLSEFLLFPIRINLKKLDGKWRNEGFKNKWIKIITGKGTCDHTKIARFAPYIDDYIGKPFTNKALLSIID